MFHKKFFESDYKDNQSSKKGRLESIMNLLNSKYEIIEPKPANIEQIALAHKQEYIESVKENDKLFNMSLLSAGSALLASEIAMQGKEFAFACNRPPGHHAYSNMGWGYCHFGNLAIALLNLRKQNRIQSAFVLDFDAHTGDGTINLLKDWKEVKILNCFAENNIKYIQEIKSYVNNLQPVDIIAVSAGFDSYKKDVGKKLEIFDYFTIGTILNKLARTKANNRLFAVLEGGYYLPDLGKNVLSFLDGLQQKTF